jgi:hypothetical protein
LNRALKADAGRGAKAVLIGLRRQLIEQAMHEGILKPEEIAELLGFSSRRQLQRWYADSGRPRRGGRASGPFRSGRSR